MKNAMVLMLGMGIGVGLSLCARELSEAILSGKEHRFVSYVGSVAAQLERYRAEHASYPETCNPDTLSSELGPLGAASGLGASRFLYCSDGQQYVLVFMPFGAEAYSGRYGAPVVASNNQLVTWPEDGRLSRELMPAPEQKP